MDVNLKNKEGQTLIVYAAIYRQFEICKFLISLGADLNSKDVLNRTPLDIIKSSNTEFYYQITEHPEMFTDILYEEQSIEENHMLGLLDFFANSYAAKCVIS